MYTVSKEMMDSILDQLNNFLSLMGYGREFEKIVKICKDLKSQGVDISKHSYIKRVLGE